MSSGLKLQSKLRIMNNSTLQVYSQAGTAHSSGVLSGNDNIPNPHLSGLAAFKQKN
jgi:hypothetical protein